MTIDYTQKLRRLRAEDQKVVKRAVSLPKALDGKVRASARGAGRSYSGVVRDALESYFNAKEDREMAEAYKAYFADPKLRKEDEELVRDWQKAAQPVWVEMDREEASHARAKRRHRLA